MVASEAEAGGIPSPTYGTFYWESSGIEKLFEDFALWNEEAFEVYLWSPSIS